MKIIKYQEIPTKFFEYKECEDLRIVRAILKEVKEKGDVAVRKYTEKFDGPCSNKIEISKEEIKKAYISIESETMNALKAAYNNIKSFAEKQKQTIKGFETNNKGSIIGQRIIPIKKIGCYVPGGRYPLPSSALMSVIAAKVAGVKEIIVCSPNIKPATIVAADMAGANRIFKIGGIQAIGALAYGTKSIPKVDKIVGPGNKYVTAAKKEVFGVVGIDFIAGPSELMIIADESSNPLFIAADLMAQAEHDPNAGVTLLTNSKETAEKTLDEIEKGIEKLITKNTIKESLKNGLIILVNTLDQAVDIANKKAPEHLSLQIKNPEEVEKNLVNYGSLFIGNYSPEVFGDYCSGTNHILPTNGASRYTGGLSVRDFVKIVTYQEIGSTAVKDMARISSKIAEIEGLDAHKKSALVRVK